MVHAIVGMYGEEESARDGDGEGAIEETESGAT
jgi:hypothetical protein